MQHKWWIDANTWLQLHVVNLFIFSRLVMRLFCPCRYLGLLFFCDICMCLYKEFFLLLLGVSWICAIIRAYGCAVIGFLLVTDIIGSILELHHYLCHFRESCLFSIILWISWDIYHCFDNIWLCLIGHFVVSYHYRKYLGMYLSGQRMNMTLFFVIVVNILEVQVILESYCAIIIAIDDLFILCHFMMNVFYKGESVS